MGRVIFLNGCSSAGKTQIVRAIQHLSDEPWLHIGVDTFFNMLPEPYVGFGEKAHAGIQFIETKDAQGAHIQVKSGPLGEALDRAAPCVLQMLADEGLNVICDEVLIDKPSLNRYAGALNNHTVYFIGVYCDLKTLQEREYLRGDRARGLARGQFEKVHSLTSSYDFVVDTTQMSSFDAAEAVLQYIKETPSPRRFKEIAGVL